MSPKCQVQPPPQAWLATRNSHFTKAQIASTTKKTRKPSFKKQKSPLLASSPSSPKQLIQLILPTRKALAQLLAAQRFSWASRYASQTTMRSIVGALLAPMPGDKIRGEFSRLKVRDCSRFRILWMAALVTNHHIILFNDLWGLMLWALLVWRNPILV